MTLNQIFKAGKFPAARLQQVCRSAEPAMISRASRKQLLLGPLFNLETVGRVGGYVYARLPLPLFCKSTLRARGS
jgi:hypothetical protein